MKSIIFLLVLVFAVIAKYESFSQGALSLRINEIMINNDSTLVDKYGNRSGWIEIFNANYYSTNIGGMFLTNDTSNPRLYPISRTDPYTEIHLRGFYIFYADNKPYRGTQHLNFELHNSEYIALYDADGKTMLDFFVIPEYIKSLKNKSYGRIIDGENELAVLSRYTPSSPNDWVDKRTKSQEILIIDPSGVGLTTIAVTIVFVSLILIFILLIFFQYLSKKGILKDSPSHHGHSAVSVKEATIEKNNKQSNETTGEVCVAIGLALHLYANQLHDNESEVLTIEHIKRSYSPWGNKHLIIKRNLLKK